MKHNIQHAGDHLAVGEHLVAFVGKGREGGESSQKAEEYKKFQFAAPDTLALSKAGQKSYEQTAEYIDCESAVRIEPSADEGLNPTGKQVP